MEFTWLRRAQCTYTPAEGSHKEQQSPQNGGSLGSPGMGLLGPLASNEYRVFKQLKAERHVLESL